MDSINLEAVLEPNHTHRYMPIELGSVMQKLIRADRDDCLDPLALESAVLECLGIMVEMGRSPRANPFKGTGAIRTTTLRNGRTLSLTADDIRRLPPARGRTNGTRPSANTRPVARSVSCVAQPLASMERTTCSFVSEKPHAQNDTPAATTAKTCFMFNWFFMCEPRMRLPIF